MITKQQLTNQLSDLVAIESLSGDSVTNAQVLDLALKLVDKKATVKRIKNKTAEILLISNIENATEKQLMNPEVGYLVHSDVVAAEKDLFEMRVSEEKIANSSKTYTVVRGRGVSDMKFSIPMGISLINDLVTNKSNKSLTVAITTDEERGGFDGALYLAEVLKFRPKELIVPDGGDNFVFVNKSKGVVQVELTAKGIEAHASRTWKGKNAITILVKIITKLLEKYDKNNQKENWNTTLNIGTISGGISPNQVCPEAKVTLDFRFPESTNIDEVFLEVKSIAKKIDRDVVIKKLSTGDPVFTDATSEVAQRFISAIRNNIEQNISVSRNYGASDARHFSKYGVPILMTKPIGGDIHQATEWVSIDSCLEYLSGLREFLGLKKIL
jgi:succinyl-diaminopimelate desuccinylase